MAHQTPIAAVLLATTLLLSACGGGGGGTSSSTTAATAAPTPTSAADATGSAGAASAPAAGTSASTTPIIDLATGLDISASPGDSPELAQALAVRSPVKVLETAPATVVAVTATPTTLVVRARADLAGNLGAMMSVRIDGSTIGSVEVRSTELADYPFNAPTLKAGSKVDVVFTNDGQVGTQDRNLYIGYLANGSTLVLPSTPGAVLDKGAGSAAFDGLDTVAGQGELYWNAALRLAWPAAATDSTLAARNAAARFLQQASFGPTTAEVTRLAAGLTPGAWIDQQIALPYSPDYVNYVQAKFALGDAYRPGGAKYDPAWVGQKFWMSATQAPDQLRKRVAFALHQIFTVSQQDSSLWYQARAYANYLDLLNKHAFGNYRNLLEDMALSPAMGIYLSHMRNRKEDATTGRLPDENFAREVMQLFSIGLVELNTDGSPKLDAQGKPIETYSNADVMALARVFTGFSWAYPDTQLTEQNFLYSNPDLATAAKDTGIDLQRMKAYPGFSSAAEKKLFSGKASAVTIPANATATDSLKLALDALFRHPNVGPFIGRQLIQRLVTSQPSPAYVARVAAVFNNNGAGVRGDLAAVVRATLLDAEARSATPAADFGKLKDPVLRVAQWLRALGGSSSSQDFMMAWEMDPVGQRAFNPASVFSYYRPGYVPPNSRFATANATAPEFQIVNESTAAAWVNLAEDMTNNGLGWNGTARDVRIDLAPQVALLAAGNLTGLLDNLNQLLLAGRMSTELRQALLDAVISIGGSDAASQLNRARLAVWLTMASNEFLVQK